VSCDAKDTEAKRGHGRALYEGCSGAPDERHAGDAQADRIVGGIAQEIERIRLQRYRPRRRAGHDLDDEEAGVDGERDP
jgi:hypothetical protein